MLLHKQYSAADAWMHARMNECKIENIICRSIECLLNYSNSMNVKRDTIYIKTKSILLFAISCSTRSPYGVLQLRVSASGAMDTASPLVFRIDFCISSII
jgi:hypothetical protein